MRIFLMCPAGVSQWETAVSLVTTSILNNVLNPFAATIANRLREAVPSYLHTISISKDGSR